MTQGSLDPKGLDPKWRQLLNWSAVIAFFAMPTMFFTLQVVAIQSPWLKFEEHLREFAWTRDYFRFIVLINLGLAGLNSFDRFTNGKPK